MRRAQLQPCYLLHRRPFRDSGQLLEVFSLEHGRLGLVARGVTRRRRGGALGELLQPFRPLLLSFAGRGDLATLGSAEAAGPHLPLRGDHLYSALYLNELLMRVLHRHEAHPNLFSHYGLALEALSAGRTIEPVLRGFELQLLEDLGYAVDLSCDAQSGMPLAEDGRYLLDPEAGLRRSEGRSQASGRLFLGADLMAIARGDLNAAVLPAAKRLTRELLAPHLGPEPLRARALFRQASGQSRGALA